MTPIPTILAAVFATTGATPDQMLAVSTKPSIAYPRFMAMLLIKLARPWWSHLDISLALGKKQPGAARHGIIRANDLLETDPQFRDAYERATAILRQSTESATAARD